MVLSKWGELYPIEPNFFHKMNEQEQLLYFALLPVKSMESFNRLRGLEVYWEKNTLHLSYYFDAPISEANIEDASTASGEIIANFAEGFLKERYAPVEPTQKLSVSSNWAYNRDL